MFLEIIMKEKKQMQAKFNLAKKNQNINFCHTMDIDRYKIVCEDFFADPQNVQKSLEISEEARFLFLESEEKFLHWLKLE